MNFGNFLHRIPRLCIRQKDRVGIRVIRVIPVHSTRRPSLAVKIALRQNPARLQKKDQFAEASVRKKHTQAF